MGLNADRTGPSDAYILGLNQRGVGPSDKDMLRTCGPDPEFEAWRDRMEQAKAEKRGIWAEPKQEVSIAQ